MKQAKLIAMAALLTAVLILLVGCGAGSPTSSPLLVQEATRTPRQETAVDSSGQPGSQDLDKDPAGGSEHGPSMDSRLESGRSERPADLSGRTMTRGPREAAPRPIADIR